MSRQTFPTYSSSCGWNAMLPSRTPRPALGTDLSVDYAIVGAGFTGLAIARRLQELEPQARIVVLEATTVGEGSSARNSGFTGSDVLPRTATLEGAQKARRQTELMTASFTWLTDIIREHGIACDLTKAGSIRAAATEAGETSLRQVVEVAKANGIAHTVLDRDNIAQRIGSHYYRFGVYLNDTYLLQPAALIRGLADALPDSIALHETTPVRKLVRSGDRWKLQTDGGVVTAKRVALANNGFIPRFGYLKLRMATIYTYAAVTKSIPEHLRDYLGKNPAWGLLPSHRLGTTLRRIGADRLMVRSLYSHEMEEHPPEAEAKLRDRFERRWSELKHVDFEYVWGGTTAFTMNGAPWWGQLDKELYASGGCNGSGIAKGTMLGRHLADLMHGTGRANEIADTMGTASLIAPEPFRSIGFHIVSSLESRRAGLES
ncbi:FAD-binding oxidoreductase [Nitratireductor sp. GZWM139]|uniref:NAD(P)/FAD-dependent oxidoreductase n=1 Tax=Nitratireductor sp. GZWM139 TaxID=2950541 RepID=UPI0024BDD2E0|nr:FAD-binding oxidoreductase [Nitratireductor sp. GZWM139]MDJ1465813.1 FAD-binding oxidoreductase [Nitratireductor sp. GZWM139]